MAHVTLAANVGNGTTSFQTLSSRTETDSYGDTTTYVSYEFTANADAGWTFSRWEERHKVTTWDTTGGSYAPPSWSGWREFSRSAVATQEFEREGAIYGTIFGDIHSEYEYEVRAVFVEATYSVSAQVSTDSPANSGSVMGSGTYRYNSTCTARAFANSGFEFKKWTTADNAQAAAVSTDATYTFAVTGDLTLYAHFVRAATGKLLYGSSNTLLHGASGTLLYDDERNPS